MRQRPRPGDPWWHGAAGYQVYLPSFADGNGDGLGDLAGLHERLDYLAWLGVDVIWLTPFYRSPTTATTSPTTARSTRDSAAWRSSTLIAKAHRLGLRVLVDLVANHTSSSHPWLVESRSSPVNPRRDWYLWRDGRGDREPPTLAPHRRALRRAAARRGVPARRRQAHPVPAR